MVVTVFECNLKIVKVSVVSAENLNFRYTDLTKKLKSNVVEAMNDLMKNFDAEFGVGSHGGGRYPHKDEHNRRFADTEETESSLDSSYNHVCSCFYYVSVVTCLFFIALNMFVNMRTCLL